MTTPPDWILDGYERSGVTPFVTFARQARAARKAGSSPDDLPDPEALPDADATGNAPAPDTAAHDTAVPGAAVAHATIPETPPAAPTPPPPAAFAGTLDPAAVLSVPFLKQAGLTPEARPADPFTWVHWTRGAEQRRQGVVWLEPTPDRSYPVLTVTSEVRVDTPEVPDIITAAFIDHFMQLTVPGEFAAQFDHNWLVARTLAPAVHTEADNEDTTVTFAQAWPVLGPVTPALLRFMTQTAYGQCRDVMTRAGYDVDPDLNPPGDTGRGDRSWLTSATLMTLVGPRWTWEESRDNEIRCVVAADLRGGKLLEMSFYLRFTSREENSLPALYLRAHTNGGRARRQQEKLYAFNDGHLQGQLQGMEFPVSIDGDGDLTVRQIVPCPQQPDPAHVQQLIEVAERSLFLATLEVLT